MDIVQYIVDNSTLSAADKQALLDDWCAASGRNNLSTNQEKKDFINAEIKMFLVDRINDYRERLAKEASIYTVFDLTK